MQTITSQLPASTTRPAGRGRLLQGFLNLWDRLSNIGLPLGDSERERPIVLVNQIATCGFVVASAYNVFYICYDLRLLMPVILVNFAGIIVFLCVLLLNHRRRYQLAKWLIVVVPNVQIFALTYYLSTASGMYLLHIMMACFPLLLAIRDKLWVRITFIVLPLGFYMAVYFLFPPANSVLALSAGLLRTLFVIDSVCVFALVILFLFLFHLEVVRAQSLLQDEYRRSERLLLNILPQEVALRLKHEPRTIADNFASVTVLFADLVGFTKMSSEMPPGRLVNMLNEVFSRFDALVEKYGLEKIKTIGDAYMVAGGIPSPVDNHLELVARLALDMLCAVEAYRREGPEVQVRIGFHTGAAVAGVIGYKKFAYDIWGDTVNLASRLESHGSPGKIQVAHTVYEHLRDRFHFEHRGVIDIKGKSPLRTYFLTAPLQA